MSTLVCHNCGHGNTTEATFCAKCATSLRRPQLVRDRRAKAFMPPQVPFELRAESSPPAKSFSGLGVLVGMIVVIGGLIIWWIIRNG